MSTAENVINLNASDPKQSNRFYTRHLYSEDYRLSIPTANFPVKCLILRNSDPPIHTLDFEELYEILSYLSCVYDLNGWTPQKPAETAAHAQDTGASKGAWLHNAIRSSHGTV